MTKKELQKQMDKSYILSDTLEMRFFCRPKMRLFTCRLGMEAS